MFVSQISSSQKRLNWGLPMLTIDLITCNLTFKIFPLYSTNEMFQFPSVCPNAHLEEEWLSGFPHEVQITTNFIQFLKLCQDFLYLDFFSGVKKCLHIVKLYCNNCIVWSVGRNGKVLAKHVKNLPKPSGLEQLRSPFGDEICRKSTNHYNSNFT